VQISFTPWQKPDITQQIMLSETLNQLLQLWS